MAEVAGYIVLSIALALGVTFIFCSSVKKKDTGEEETNTLLEMKLEDYESVDPRQESC